MTNLSICNNIIIDFYSHNSCKNKEVYKDFGYPASTPLALCLTQDYNEDYIDDGESILADESSQDDEAKSMMIENFELKVITDVYSDFLNGEDVYFLDSDGNPVRVKSIDKVPYSGKIYDVDVENDVILVERRGREETRNSERDDIDEKKSKDMRRVGSNDKREKNCSQNVLSLSDTNNLAEKSGEAGFGAMNKSLSFLLLFLIFSFIFMVIAEGEEGQISENGEMFINSDNLILSIDDKILTCQNGN